MKSIRQKAKAYDKALEIAKKVHKYSSDIAEIKRIEEIFPELKESDDEKIRKALIDYFDDANKACENPLQSYGIHTDNVIAWLEKLKVFTEHDEGLYYFANSEFTYVGNPTSDDGSVLEKQAEQKKFIDNLTPQEAMDIAVAKCFDEQKPTDKTEPKFEVGDWIIRSAEGFKHNTYLVTEVKDYYVCEELKGRRVTFTFNDVHKNFKLWDISDAKDGDALAVKGAPFIYKNNDKDYVYLYCGVNLSNEFVEAKKIDSWNNNNKVYPATKEQRDTLFAKMRDEGYMWDAKKKELKKIEVVWTEEDDLMLLSIIQSLEITNGAAQVKIDWLKNIKQRIGGE